MYELPKLNYDLDALEPYIDTATMQVHYGKHHQAFCDNFNKAMEKYPGLADRPAEDIIRDLNSLPVAEDDRKKIRNFGGGYINHSFFWKLIDPANIKDEELIDDINKTFGSVDEFKKQFNQQALALFGSGWTWLVRDQTGKLEICSLPNQDSPLTMGHTPLLTIDLWEHAYYLKYQNRRPEYIDNWWKTIKII